MLRGIRARTGTPSVRGLKPPFNGKLIPEYCSAVTLRARPRRHFERGKVVRAFQLLSVLGLLGLSACSFAPTLPEVNAGVGHGGSIGDPTAPPVLGAPAPSPSAPSPSPSATPRPSFSPGPIILPTPKPSVTPRPRPTPSATPKPSPTPKPGSGKEDDDERERPARPGKNR